MADVITLPLAQLSFGQLKERRQRRQRQLREFGHIPLIVETAEKDLEAIEAEWKRKSAEVKEKMKSIRHVVPKSES